MKNVISILFSILFLFGCVNPDTNQTKEATKEEISVDLSNINSNLIPSIEDVNIETTKKKGLFPESYKTSWVINAIEDKFDYFGFNGKRMNEIGEIYRKAITANVLFSIVEREAEYKKVKEEKYSNLTCNISYQKIKKGDIILAETRNAYLMGVDSENNLHHALLCVKDPTSDEDIAFITNNGFGNPEVKLYPLNQLKQHDDYVIVLRSYYPEKINIDKIVSYALSQLGKGYNTNFTDKETDESFYCTQLVWRAYIEAGINIDYNDHLYNDYNLVLASDIYKSPYLYIVDFSD